MKTTIIDSNHRGWKIMLLEFSGMCAEKVREGMTFPLVQNYSARNVNSGIVMNTNSLSGIKRSIDIKNAEIRRGPSWRN